MRNAIFPYLVDYDNLRLYCSMLDGKIPLFDTPDTFAIEYERIRDEFSQMNNTSVTTKCNGKKEGNVKIWTGFTNQKINGEMVWFDSYSGDQLANKWQDSIEEVKEGRCSQADGLEIFSWPCNQPFPCGVCEVSKYVNYKLKGLCFEATEVRTGMLDHKFLINGTTLDGLVWRGFFQSKILRVDDKWRLQSLKDPAVYLENDDPILPLGRGIWTTNPDTEEMICEMDPGTDIRLTFTACTSDQFTCDNGECIHLDGRCNNKLDCFDQSDEMECYFVTKSRSYLDQLIPPPESNVNPRLVYINVTIKSFPSIDTIGLKFTADFYLNLRWFDPRLTFNNIVSVVLKHTM